MLLLRLCVSLLQGRLILHCLCGYEECFHCRFVSCWAGSEFRHASLRCVTSWAWRMLGSVPRAARVAPTAHAPCACNTCVSCTCTWVHMAVAHLVGGLFGAGRFSCVGETPDGPSMVSGFGGRYRVPAARRCASILGHLVVVPFGGDMWATARGCGFGIGLFHALQWHLPADCFCDSVVCAFWVASGMCDTGQVPLCCFSPYTIWAHSRYIFM